MKFCKDCRWCRQDWWADALGWNLGCFHKNADVFANVVDGARPVPRLMRIAYRGFYAEQCETELCGPDAKWFEPKDAE
jgi:hypothetical protein